MEKSRESLGMPLSKMKIESISDREIERARRVLEDHTVKPLNREGAFESGLFSICSQATPYETASKFIYTLRCWSHSDDEKAKHKYSSMKVLSDKERVNSAAEKTRWRFTKGRRFDSFIDYFSGKKGEWWIDVRDADFDERKKYIQQIRWISDKTFDFWTLCLGRNSIALDVHIMRNLKALGIEIPANFVDSAGRKIGTQKVRKTPNRIEYERITTDTIKLFEQDERFRSNCHLNLALVDAILWWRGANRGERDQGYLFGDSRSELIIPYGKTLI